MSAEFTSRTSDYLVIILEVYEFRSLESLLVVDDSHHKCDPWVYRLFRKLFQLAKPVAALELKVVSTGPKGNFPSEFCKLRREIWGATHENFFLPCINKLLSQGESIV